MGTIPEGMVLRLATDISSRRSNTNRKLYQEWIR
ncbi:hypothetical protein Rleg9DRAFT_7189 [Rhizobium leguminosarum bv. trifolii WSM597]|uniref:Uncharacterized protein n=1 Tax=Rhizobium leguminosarum bv. trifolii WSM597 TaxID=754764 RepID=I9NMT1_RHILT|nr:hypothetical protein Rleg9DRAFT_7189 [Rhizobium leguminosarum bv. trifolii WSM597]